MAKSRTAAVVDRAVSVLAGTFNILLFVGAVLFLGALGGGPDSDTLMEQTQSKMDAELDYQHWLEDMRKEAGDCPDYPSSECPAHDRFDERSWPCMTGQVKANRRSGIYHPPTSRWYAETRADVGCFQTAGKAGLAGFRAAQGG